MTKTAREIKFRSLYKANPSFGVLLKKAVTKIKASVNPPLNRKVKAKIKE